MDSQVLESESHDEYVCDSQELLREEYDNRRSVCSFLIS